MKKAIIFGGVVGLITITIVKVVGKVFGLSIPFFIEIFLAGILNLCIIYIGRGKYL